MDHNNLGLMGSDFKRFKVFREGPGNEANQCRSTIYIHQGLPGLSQNQCQARIHEKPTDVVLFLLPLKPSAGK